MISDFVGMLIKDGVLHVSAEYFNSHQGEILDNAVDYYAIAVYSQEEYSFMIENAMRNNYAL